MGWRVLQLRLWLWPGLGLGLESLKWWRQKKRARWRMRSERSTQELVVVLSRTAQGVCTEACEWASSCVDRSRRRSTPDHRRHATTFRHIKL